MRAKKTEVAHRMVRRDGQFWGYQEDELKVSWQCDIRTMAKARSGEVRIQDLTLLLIYINLKNKKRERERERWSSWTALRSENKQYIQLLLTIN